MIPERPYVIEKRSETSSSDRFTQSLFPEQSISKSSAFTKNPEIELIKIKNEAEFNQNRATIRSDAQIKSAPPEKTKAEKATYYKNEILAGIICGFVLVPQECAYSIIGNFDASLGTHSAWIIGIVCAIFGGRPGMINGLTGGLASIVSQFVILPKNANGSGKGIEEFFLATILAGAIILVCGLLRLGKFQIMIPATVKVGFCNGLAIIIGMSLNFYVLVKK